MKKISVIIPCYNAELYISECVNSVLKQTFSPLEIICVNDGSTDNTLAVLDSLGHQHSTVLKIINSENKGASAARNIGLNLAQGEVVQFLDADDVIEPNKFEKQIVGLELHDIVVSDWIEKNNTLSKTLGSYYFNEIDKNPLETAIRKIIITGNPLYKIAAAKKIGGYNESLTSAQDWDFHIRLILADFKIKYVPGVYYVHRKVEDSISSNWIKVSIQASDIIIKLKPFLLKNVWMNQNTKQYIARIYSDSALYCSNRKNADKYVDEIMEWTMGDYSFINNRIKRFAASILGMKLVIRIQRSLR
jgi:glycosyltransferase involved in cell wall biosynthesis